MNNWPQTSIKGHRLPGIILLPFLKMPPMVPPLELFLLPERVQWATARLWNVANETHPPGLRVLHWLEKGGGGSDSEDTDSEFRIRKCYLL